MASRRRGADQCSEARPWAPPNAAQGLSGSPDLDRIRGSDRQHRQVGRSGLTGRGPISSVVRTPPDLLLGVLVFQGEVISALTREEPLALRDLDAPGTIASSRKNPDIGYTDRHGQEYVFAIDHISKVVSRQLNGLHFLSFRFDRLDH